MDVSLIGQHLDRTGHRLVSEVTKRRGGIVALSVFVDGYEKTKEET